MLETIRHFLSQWGVHILVALAVVFTWPVIERVVRRQRLSVRTQSGKPFPLVAVYDLDSGVLLGVTDMGGDTWIRRGHHLLELRYGVSERLEIRNTESGIWKKAVQVGSGQVDLTARHANRQRRKPKD